MHRRWILLGLGLFLSAIASAEGTARQNGGGVEISETLSVALVDAEGKSLSRFVVAPDTQALPEVLFKVTLGKGHEKHRGWALEITEPARKASVRLAYEGSVPSVLRWNGVFSDGKRLQPGSRYFMRILLAMDGKKRVASNWSFFAVELKALELAKDEGSIRLHLSPSVAGEVAVLQTKSFRSLHFPVIVGDLRLLWGDRNSAGVRFETSSNIIYNYRPTATGFFYSDISLLYLYRWKGKPVKPGPPAYVPVYAAVALQSSEKDKGTDNQVNIDVGGRIFSTVLRGFGDQPIDLETGRRMQGLAASVRMDKRAGDFRIHAMGEVGYTFLSGKILMFGGQVSMMYERFYSVSPGVQVRVQQFSGNAADDGFDGIATGGPESIVNRLAFIGMTLQFKL